MRGIGISKKNCHNMAVSEIIVIASAKAKLGREKDLEAQFRMVIPPTHEEKGCIKYAFHKSLSDPQAYVMVERWTSKEALDQHLASPHVQTLFKNIADLVQAPPIIQVLESIPAGQADKGIL